MRYIPLLAFFMLALLIPQIAAAGGKHQQAVPVLGQPFGTIVTIRGTIADIRDTGMKRDEGRRLIRVSEIAGRRLEKPFHMPLETFSFAAHVLPERGALVTLRGYEEGAFRGIPEGAFKNIPIVATDGFHFESCFRVTAVITD